jgi:hypothetical protein
MGIVIITVTVTKAKKNAKKRPYLKPNIKDFLSTALAEHQRKLVLKA